MIKFNKYKNKNKIMSLNTYIPPVKELKGILKNDYITWVRDSKQNWTNCSWEMLNYMKKWRNIRLFMKKSFIRWDSTIYENEYKLIKSKFKNIVPNQWFIQAWADIFVFCAPINIKIDVFNDRNNDYFYELLKKDNRLLKQVKFFIKNYNQFLEEWKILDLYWKENLVISDDNKLYYIDSFLIFQKSRSVRDESIENINYLKDLVKKIENPETDKIN